MERTQREESWRDLAPGAVHGPLRQAAQEFFISAVPIPEDESRNGSRIRQTIAADFYQQLNSDFSGNSEDGVLALSQPEADYSVLLMKLASTPSGPVRDGLLRDITLARVKLVTKEERAPLTRGLRGLIQKAGGERATGWLKPGSDEKRLQIVEGVVLQKLGHQDLRMLFEAKEETRRQVLEKFMGRKIEEIAGQEEHELTEKDQEPATPGEAELSKNVFGKISRWLKRVDWKFVGRGSTSMLAGIGLSELLGSASWIGGALLGVNMLLRRVGGAEKVEGFIKSREAKYPKASEKMTTRVAMGVAMGELKLVQAALKVVESPEAMFIGAGLVAGAGIRQVSGLVQARQAAQQAAAGGGGGGSGEGPVAPTISEPVESQPPVVLSPQAGDFVNRAGEVAAQEAREMADAAQGAAEMAARQAALDAATRTVVVNPGDTLTGLVAQAGGDSYGADFTNTILQSANMLTGPQNPHRDMAGALIEFIKAHPGGVNWRDAINGVGDLAKQMVGGVPLKDAIAQATRMIYPGQEMKIVVGAAMP